MKKPLLATLGLLASVGAVALGSGISLADTAPAPGGGPAHADRGHDPKRMAERCDVRFALEAGRLAYLEARLELTEAQKPLWDAYKTASATADAKSRDACLAAVPAKAQEDGERPSIVDREAARIRRMETELAQLKATQPALAALYPTLTAEQKEIIDRPPHGDGHGGMMRARFDRGDHRHGDRGRGPGGAPVPVPPPPAQP